MEEHDNAFDQVIIDILRKLLFQMNFLKLKKL